jgi:hypothetical protein
MFVFLRTSDHMFKKYNMLSSGSLSGSTGRKDPLFHIRTEADAAIGSTGVPLSTYIQENQGAAPQPLLDNSANDWIENLFEAQELRPGGLPQPTPYTSKAPYDTSWKSSYHGRYPEPGEAMGLNTVSDDESSDGYLEYEDEESSASSLTEMDSGGSRAGQAAADEFGGMFDAFDRDFGTGAPVGIKAPSGRAPEYEGDGELKIPDPEDEELSFSDTRAEGVRRAGVTDTSETLGGLPNPPTHDPHGYDTELGGPTDVMSQQPGIVDEAAVSDFRGSLEDGATAKGFIGRTYDNIKGGVKGLFGAKKTYNAQEWAEPLLQGTEMTTMPSHKALPISDQPTQAELSALNAPGPELGGAVLPRQALSDIVRAMEDDGMGPEAISAELGIGVSKGGGMWISRATLGQYLAKQGKGLLMSPLIAGMVAGLNQIHDGVGDMVSLGMIGADLLMTGDPLGILVYGVGQLWDAANQSRQKVLDNDSPDKDYGTRMGYVREGDTWYPAIFNQRYKSTGLWSGDQQITMDYGKDIIWKMDGEGSFKPMIPDAKAKNFVASDVEWDGETRYGRGDGALLSGKDFVTGGAFGTPGSGDSRKMMDTTRDWYFLSKDDMKKVHSGDLHLESYTDDETEMNSSARQLNDWRKALDHSQDWKWSSAVQTMGAGAAVNNYAGSRELQRIMYEAEDQMAGGIYVSSETDYDKFQQDSSARTGDTWDDGHSLYNTFGSYLKETVLQDHIQALYRAQLVAAKEIGFDKLYGSPDHADDKLPEDGATVWSATYLDLEKDMPTASSANELQEQLHNIELMNDRTAAGRNYLAQKVQTRYWMQQISAAGGSQDMFDYLYKYSGDKMGNTDTWGKRTVNRDGYGTHKYTASALREFQEYIPDQTKNKFNPYGDYLQGFVQPWQNDGEGALPNYTGALDRTNAENFIDPGYRDAYEDMGRDGWDNMQSWIDTYGKVDPSARISALEDIQLPTASTEKLDTTDDVIAEDHAVATDPYLDHVEQTPGLKGTLKGGTLGGKGGDDLWSRFAAATGKDKDKDKTEEDTDKTEEDKEVDKKELPAGSKSLEDLFAEFNARDDLPGVDPVVAPVAEDPADAWRKRGIELGLIDEDFTLPTRAGSENSHIPDTTRATHAVSMPHYHTVEHEDFGVPGMSSTMLSFIHAAEAPPASTQPAIKVI